MIKINTVFKERERKSTKEEQQMIQVNPRREGEGNDDGGTKKRDAINPDVNRWDDDVSTQKQKLFSHDLSPSKFMKTLNHAFFHSEPLGHF